MRNVMILALAMVAPAAARAGSFTPPQGCTTHLTVQSRGCYVANYYTCEADPKGDQWRADFDQEGMFFLSHIDSETQWVESIEMNPTVTQRLDPGAKDPASFSNLLTTGRDDFNFSLSKDNGEHSNVAGYDQLTGKTAVINGVTLEETQYEYAETDDAGTVLRKSRGHEYISRDWRLFFSGHSEWWDGANWQPLEGSPAAFILPGEKGFAATQPIFDCDAQMSALEVPMLHRAALSVAPSASPKE
ncbi:hypothetical protein [Fuscibacter oryzae]|uniref:Uncharacterized protein n=1 Tax=Fuscibacter oryzae TaxID=2803939 RepID=A0A8J7MU57_9RHOB|nr:hypothetical protein [Fuscibacter oryzae]MBL4929662.1 hypothetical protein [Fuscibacter oryzae]